MLKKPDYVINDIVRAWDVNVPLSVLGELKKNIKI